MPNCSETGYNPNSARDHAVRTLARFVGVSLLWVSLACGPGGIDAQNNTANITTSENTQPKTTCVDSYPGATVLNIVGGDPNTPVTVDQSKDGTIDFNGAAVNAPELQYNEGPLGLDSKPIWDAPVVDGVCFTK